MPRKLNYKSYVLSDFYKSYKAYISDNPLYDIQLELFIKVVRDYFKFLSIELVDNAKEIRIPARLGVLSVIKHRPKVFNKESLRIDFKSTKEINKTVFHMNEHSGGYNFRFHWDKRNIIIPNNAYYELVMCRKAKRRLAYLIKEENKDYIER